MDETPPRPRPAKRTRPTLEQGVDRLSNSTTDLAVVLDRLNDTQARLAATESTVDTVKAEAIRQDDLDARDRLEHRSRMLVWLALGGGLITALFTVAYVSNAAHGTCDRRQESTVVVIDVLESFKTPGQDNSRLTAGQARLRETLDRTCDEQYPIHF